MMSCGPADVCEEAVNKMTGECGFGSGAAIDGTIGECVDLRECNAECAVDADCEEIAEQSDPANPRQPNAYEQCLSDCQINAP
jgi:hypothetical protein